MRVLTAGVGSDSLDVLPLPSEPPDSSRPRSRCPGTPSAPPASMGEEHRLERLFHAAASAYSTRHRCFRRPHWLERDLGLAEKSCTAVVNMLFFFPFRVESDGGSGQKKQRGQRYTAPSATFDSQE